ncbi:MAG: tripartite tricarboxylate transporter permease, partial [Spirochaetales bacterium]|nr:tripartite tricarboxylate transporter permease [Spirochaetales bacterium]
GILVIPILMRILKVPKKILAPIIIGVCVIGSYSVGNSIFDVEVMIIAGSAAYYMKKCGYPMAPIVLAFVLGPIFELKARQALEISNCNLMIFVQKPISAVFLGITLILCLAPVVMNIRKKIKAKKAN